MNVINEESELNYLRGGIHFPKSLTASFVEGSWSCAGHQTLMHHPGYCWWLARHCETTWLQHVVLFPSCFSIDHIQYQAISNCRTSRGCKQA